MVYRTATSGAAKHSDYHTYYQALQSPKPVAEGDPDDPGDRAGPADLAHARVQNSRGHKCSCRSARATCITRNTPTAGAGPPTTAARCAAWHGSPRRHRRRRRGPTGATHLEGAFPSAALAPAALAVAALGGREARGARRGVAGRARIRPAPPPGRLGRLPLNKPRARSMAFCCSSLTSLTSCLSHGGPSTATTGTRTASRQRGCGRAAAAPRPAAWSHAIMRVLGFCKCKPPPGCWPASRWSSTRPAG
jgi:hypothetical protein